MGRSKPHRLKIAAFIRSDKSRDTGTINDRFHSNDMTRYHFHAADGSQFRDEDGEELPGLEAAKGVALEVLTEMLPSKAEEFWESKMFSVHVKDQSGRLIASLTTVATLDPVPRPDVPPER